MITTLKDERFQAGQPGATLNELAGGYSIEVTDQALDALSHPVGHIAPGTRVYLPFLAGSGFADNLDACRRLAGMGLRPVPHLAARALTGPDELDRDLPRYVEAGVDALLLIAGDLAEPVGPFSNTMQVLDTGLLEKHGIRRLGVAGHPEGHPYAEDAELIEALRVKAAYARATGTEMWVTTQFLFDAAPLKNWDERLRAAGIDLPVRAGVPGPAKLSTLVSFALKCGVGASARMLTKRPSAMKLLGRWSPEPLVDDIAAHMARTPQTLIEGIHIYTFGGVQTALDWLATLEEPALAEAGE